MSSGMVMLGRRRAARGMTQGVRSTAHATAEQGGILSRKRQKSQSFFLINFLNSFDFRWTPSI